MTVGIQEYTPEALRRLEAHITGLEEQLATAHASLGDAAEGDNNTWHDNPAFEEANREIRRLNAELARLKRLRGDAKVIEAVSTVIVSVGSVVTITHAGNDEEEAYLIGGHHVVRKDAGGPGGPMEISSTSPLGAVLLGQPPGAQLVYRGPTGREFRVAIKSIS